MVGHYVWGLAQGTCHMVSTLLELPYAYRIGFHGKSSALVAALALFR